MNNSNQSLVTILQQDCTESLEEKFFLRKKLYENKDIMSQFKNIDINDPIFSSIENKEEFVELKRNIQRGKNILVEELKKHKELAIKNIEINEFESITKTICSECEHRMSLMKSYFQNHKEAVNELQDYLDGISYSIQQIMDLINKTVTNRTDEIKKDIEKNTAIIKYMADTFYTLKHSQFGHICPICLTNEVNIFCDPCGHCFCNKCLTNANHCYMCRLRINKTHPLFFP